MSIDIKMVAVERDELSDEWVDAFVVAVIQVEGWLVADGPPVPRVGVPVVAERRAFGAAGLRALHNDARQFCVLARWGLAVAVAWGATPMDAAVQFVAARRGGRPVFAKRPWFLGAESVAAVAAGMAVRRWVVSPQGWWVDGDDDILGTPPNFF